MKTKRIVKNDLGKILGMLELNLMKNFIVKNKIRNLGKQKTKKFCMN